MQLKMKIKRSAKELEKVNSVWRPAEQDADREMITEEERTCFRKIGLKLTSSLALGRQYLFIYKIIIFLSFTSLSRSQQSCL